MIDEEKKLIMIRSGIHERFKEYCKRKGYNLSGKITILIEEHLEKEGCK